MAEFTPINTQEEFDALISDRIQRAQNTVRKEYADYDSVKSELSTAKTDLEKAAQQNTDLSNQIKELQEKLSKSETDSAKTRIALEMGLPLEMCSRLQGKTEDELREDAKGLASLFTRQNVPPLFNPEAQAEDTKQKALKGLLGQIMPQG